MERRLATILAADVVSFSRLMSDDKTAVVAGLEALREELFAPLIRSHHGRVVKLMGDGRLVEFGSVADAVTCANDIQKALASKKTSAPDAIHFEFWIGINLGDVIVDGDDLYGDGVNAAARMEAAADPGAVLVSQTVFDHSAGKADMAFRGLGERQSKNIPIQCVSIPSSLRGLRWRDLVSKAGESLASVLPCSCCRCSPLAGLADDDEHAYVAEGLSEDIIVELHPYRVLSILSGHATSA